MLKALLNKRLNIKEYLVIFFFIFLLHLITINWYPTNFEGAYSKLAFFFLQQDKLFLIDSFYNVQANTIIFSLLSSLLSKAIIFLSPEATIRILSATSYFFLILAFKNLLSFLKKENKLLFLIIFISNPLIWYYGHRIYVDLFAFSIGIYGFSILLDNFKDKKKVLQTSLWVSFAIILKPFNLIYLPIIFIYLFFIEKIRSELKFNLIVGIILPIFIFFIFLFLNKYYFDFYLLPDKFISDGSIFIKLEKIDLVYLLNIFSNFIYYVGYLGLITFPLLFRLTKKSLNKNLIFKIIIIFSISFLLSKFLSSNYGEINLGPFQRLFNLDFYKLIICTFFTYIFYLIFSLKKIVEERFDLKKIYFFISIILIYIFALSFLKLSQRYLLLTIPFFYCLIFIISNSIYIYMINLKFNVLIILLLLLNYNIQSNLTSQLFSIMKERDIIFQTDPGPLLPHLMHEYQHIINYKNKRLMYFDTITRYKISNKPSSDKRSEVFSYNLFGKSLKKIYLVSY